MRKKRETRKSLPIEVLCASTSVRERENDLQYKANSEYLLEYTKYLQDPLNDIVPLNVCYFQGQLEMYYLQICIFTCKMKKKISTKQIKKDKQKQS